MRVGWQRASEKERETETETEDQDRRFVSFRFNEWRSSKLKPNQSLRNKQHEINLKLCQAIVLDIIFPSTWSFAINGIINQRFSLCVLAVGLGYVYGIHVK